MLVGRKKERREQKRGRLTREQMLQLQPWICSLPSASGPLVFNASVTLPQWQEPVYNFAFSISVTGSGPLKGWGV